MNRARKTRKRMCICVCEGEANPTHSGERVEEMHRLTSSEVIVGTCRWSNRGKIIRKRRNSKMGWSDSEVIFLSFGWQISFTGHSQRREDESLRVSGMDVGTCPAGGAAVLLAARGAFLRGPGLVGFSSSTAGRSVCTQLSSAWISRLRWATRTSARTGPSIYVTDLGK